MDAILKSGTDTVLEFEVIKGSHIYIFKEDGANAFLEWEDVPDEVREVCLRAAEKLEDAFKGCSSASAAVVERYARLEQESVSA